MSNEQIGASLDTSQPAATEAPWPAGAGGAVKAALDAVSGGPQGRRASMTYERLRQLEGAPIPEAWAAILVRAAGTPRSTAKSGREGILSPLEAQNAALASRDLSAEERAAIDALLEGASVAGQADPTPAQALILKTLGARRRAFKGSDAPLRAKAIDEIRAFAEAIHGLGFGDLMRKTSLLDIDETIDTESFDPLSLEDRPRQPADRPLSFTGADNDGLFQRYEMSCGPSSIEVLLGERDPAYALRRRATPMDLDPAPEDDIQTRVLTEFGMTPASRVVPSAISRLRAAISALQASSALSEEAAAQVSDYVLGSPDAPKGPLVDEALSTIRAANAGFPSDATVRQIIAYTPPERGRSYNTIGFRNVVLLLNRLIGEDLGVEYKLRSLYDDLGVKMGSDEASARAPEYVRAVLDPLAKALDDGVDIVFGTSYPDHFWSMSSVDGASPDRRFLVHDTWSGRTGWVAESALIDGSFARAFLGERKVYTFIDLVYLI